MEGWYCNGCRSLNRPRADRCYSCGERGGMTESVLPARPDWWVPPVAPVPMGHASPAPGRRHRPANALAWAVVLLIGLSVALTTAIALVVGTSSLSPYDVAFIGSSRWRVAIDLTLLRLLLWIAAPIAWFLWFDRVLRNVEPLTGDQPASSRIGAVVWWFVPFASIWRPARAVGDVYRRLAVPGTPGPWLPAFWWLSWIGTTLVPVIFGFILGFVAGLRRMPMDRVQEGDLWLDRIGDGLEIAAGILAITMIIAIQRAQGARAAALGTAGAAAAPLVGPDRPAWDASGPASPVPSALPARPGSLPVRSLIVAGAIVASGLLASAALAQGLPTSSPSAAARATATPTSTTAVPTASPSPTASPASTATWTVIDRFRSKVLDPEAGYSGRIALDGSIRADAGSLVVRGRITGTIVVSGRDFLGRDHVTSAVPEMRSDMSIAVIAGRIWVRQGDGGWSSVTSVPETFAIDPLQDLLWSHDLIDLGPGDGRDRDLVRIGWPVAEAGLAATMDGYAGGSVDAGGVTLEVLARPDGTPARVEYDIRGTFQEDGRPVDFRIAITYRYSDVGQPIAVPAPDAGD